MEYPSLTLDQITILGPADSAALETKEVIRKADASSRRWVT